MYFSGISPPVIEYRAGTRAKNGTQSQEANKHQVPPWRNHSFPIGITFSLDLSLVLLKPLAVFNINLPYMGFTSFACVYLCHQIGSELKAGTLINLCNPR